MKKIAHYILFFTLMSCEVGGYKDEKCIGYQELTHVNALRVGSLLPDFTAYTPEGTRISPRDLKQRRLFIFFKSNHLSSGFLANKEILHKGLGEMASEYNADLVIGSDLKIANLYGLDIDSDRLSTSFLFIADEKNIILKIYKDVCEEDIVTMLKKERTVSP